MELSIHSLEHFGEVCVLRLNTPDSFPAHQVGHYAVLQFANFAERPYSIANAPNGQFVAGPVDMLRTTIDKALAAGVSPDVIHSDVRELDRTK